MPGTHRKEGRAAVHDARGERYGAVGGLVFVVFLAIAGVLGGEPPATSDSPTVIAAYLAEHQAELEAGVWLLGLGSVALIWWFGSLWQRMVRAERGSGRLAVVSLTGLAVSGSLAMVSAALWATAAGSLQQLGATAPAFYRLGAMLLGMEGFGLATHLLAANVAGARTHTLPRWLVVPGFTAAAAFLLSAVLIAAGVDVNSSIGLLAFALWCAWILGVSYCIWSGSRLPQEAPGA